MELRRNAWGMRDAIGGAETAQVHGKFSRPSLKGSGRGWVATPAKAGGAQPPAGKKKEKAGHRAQPFQTHP